MTANTKRPRIVARDPDEHPALDSEDSYEFFTGAESRVTAVKAKITERENVLFDLGMSREMIEGNPNLGECTKSRTTPQGCQCEECSLARVTEMEASVKYGLRKLRALHSRLS